MSVSLILTLADCINMLDVSPTFKVGYSFAALVLKHSRWVMGLSGWANIRAMNFFSARQKSICVVKQRSSVSIIS
jgi:hypothetical protein